MIAATLSKLFPPTMRGRVPHGSITLALIEQGQIATYQPDPPEGGPVCVRAWTGQRWETIKEYRNEKPLGSGKSFQNSIRVFT